MCFIEQHCSKYLLKYTLRKKVQLGTLFVPLLEFSGKRVPKGSLHVQDPKKVPYLTKNYSKEPKKVLKTHLEPFREPIKVPPVGEPLFSKSVYKKIICPTE